MYRGEPSAAIDPGSVQRIPTSRFRSSPEDALGSAAGHDALWYTATAPDGEALLLSWAADHGLEPRRGAGSCPLAADYGPGLGDDRLLAAHQAVSRLGAPCAVVGCGSALTVDLVVLDDGGPRFSGGAILAGERLILGSLSALGRLPALEPASPTSPPGRTTEDCLRLGAHRQCVSAVAGLLDEYSRLLGLEAAGLPLLLHGGDARRYQQDLPRAVVDEFAVLGGLIRCASPTSRTTGASG